MTQVSHHTALGPMNRPDLRGLMLSALIPTAIVVLANGMVFAAGWSEKDPAFTSLPFSPPGWLVALIWVAVYPMWGYARWKVWQTNAHGRRESWWVVALIGYGLAYPILSGAFNTVASAWANLAALLLAMVTAFRVGRISKVASAWIVPSLAWISFATVLGFAALSNR